MSTSLPYRIGQGIRDIGSRARSAYDELTGAVEGIPDDIEMAGLKTASAASDLYSGLVDNPADIDTVSDLPGGGWNQDAADAPAAPAVPASSPDWAARGRELATKLLGGGGASAPASTPAAAAPKPASPYRAVRMPNGTFLFTNQNYGGVEVAPEDAGAVMRAEGDEGAANLRSTGLEESMGRSLSSQALRRNIVRPEIDAVKERFVAGPKFQDTPTASAIEGTPFQQIDLAQEMAGKTADLARTQQTQEYAELSPEEAAMLKNDHIMLGQWITNKFGNKLQVIEQNRLRNVKAVSTPGTEHYISDPEQRAQAIKDINQSARTTAANEKAIASLVANQAVPRY